MKLFVIISALIVLQVVRANPVKRNCNGCTYEDVNYAVNQTWTAICVTYKCVDDGNIAILTKRCPDPSDNTICKDVDDTWVSNVASGDSGYCINYVCHQPADTSILPYAQGSNLQCSYKGSCFADGAYVDIADCYRVTCTVGPNNTVSTAITSTPDCVGNCYQSVNNVTSTHAAGDTWLIGCYRYTCVGDSVITQVRECCEITFNGSPLTFQIGPVTLAGIPCTSYTCDVDTAFTLVSVGCSDRDGGCHLVGDNWMETCFNYTCAANGQKSFVSGGCYDSANNLCRDVNEEWTVMTANGSPHETTGVCYEKLCSFADNTFTISNAQTRCMLNGACYDRDTVQDYVVADCSLVSCGYETIDGVPSLLTKFSTKCKDVNGNCHDYGTNGWPLTLAGQACNNCTCNKVDNQILYSCYDA